MRGSKISLIKVRSTKEHVDITFDLLKKRHHKISHTKMPSYAAHKRFVLSHLDRYRVWYVIRVEKDYVGAIYLNDRNSIGVSVTNGAEKYIRSAIELVLQKHRPLPAKKSVRTATFDVNVPPSDIKQIAVLKSMGLHLAQVTYSF